MAVEGLERKVLVVSWDFQGRGLATHEGGHFRQHMRDLAGKIRGDGGGACVHAFAR